MYKFDVSANVSINSINRTDLREKNIPNGKEGLQNIICYCKYENKKWNILGFDNNGKIDCNNNILSELFKNNEKNFKLSLNKKKYEIKKVESGINYLIKEEIDKNPIPNVYAPGPGGFWIKKYDVLYNDIESGILLFNDNIEIFKRLKLTPSIKELDKFHTWNYILEKEINCFIDDNFSGFMCIVYKIGKTMAK